MVRYVFDILFHEGSSNGKGTSNILDLGQTTVFIDNLL